MTGTSMNAHAESRPLHAIFTIHVRQRRLVGAQASAPDCAQRLSQSTARPLPALLQYMCAPKQSHHLMAVSNSKSMQERRKLSRVPELNRHLCMVCRGWASARGGQGLYTGVSTFFQACSACSKLEQAAVDEKLIAKLGRCSVTGKA